MKIFELTAVTATSNFVIPVSGTYSTEKGYSVLSKRAFEYYQRKIEKDSALSEFKLRLVIYERETDMDGIFKLSSTTFEDYIYDGKNIIKISTKKI